jgi:quinol monooxygenase YgiN
MIAASHFESGADDFAQRATDALVALAGRPGYLRGTVARSTDDPERWLLVTEWANVGSYRRALRATPLLAEAVDLPSAFEPLADVPPGGAVVRHDSDRA